jgi:putative FmdB family regulatory protein
MPVYDFICANCGETMTMYQSKFPADGDGDVFIVCEHCGGRARRAISRSPSIRLAWKPSHRQLALTRPNRER